MGMTTFYVQELEAKQAKEAAIAARAAKEAAKEARAAKVPVKDKTEDAPRSAPQSQESNPKQMEA